MRYPKPEVQESLAKLREMLKPGDTVYCVLKHTSRSGTLRHIQLLVIRDGEPVDITWRAAVVLGWSLAKDGAVKVIGCGMNMGFRAVYKLSHTLFRSDSRATKYVGAGQANMSARVTDRDAGYWLTSRWL